MATTNPASENVMFRIAQLPKLPMYLVLWKAIKIMVSFGYPSLGSLKTADIVAMTGESSQGIRSCFTHRSHPANQAFSCDR